MLFTITDRITLSEKINIVEDRRKGESVSSLQTKYNLAQSTMYINYFKVR